MFGRHWIDKLHNMITIGLWLNCTWYKNIKNNTVHRNPTMVIHGFSGQCNNRIDKELQVVPVSPSWNAQVHGADLLGNVSNLNCQNLSRYWVPQVNLCHLCYSGINIWGFRSCHMLVNNNKKTESKCVRTLLSSNSWRARNPTGPGISLSLMLQQTSGGIIVSFVLSVAFLSRTTVGNLDTSWFFSKCVTAAMQKTCITRCHIGSSSCAVSRGSLIFFPWEVSDRQSLSVTWTTDPL